MKGGLRGAAVVAGDPGSGTLIAALEHAGELKMPPGGDEKKLPADTVRAFREWVAAGAAYGPAASEAAWDYAEEDLWAFRPLQKTAPPEIADTEMKIRTPVDRFILEKLAEKKLAARPAGG